MTKTTPKRLLIILFSTLGLLLIPLIATLASDKVHWKPGDFILGGLMLFGLGMLIQFLRTKLKGKKILVPLIIAIVVIFILIWLELAVGIFGTPLAGN